MSMTRVSLRKESLYYGVPKNTLSLYVNEKLKFRSRRGLTPVLTHEQENKIVEIAEIGNGYL